MLRLLYTGPAPVTFVALGVEVEPGATFDAPAGLAEALLRRPDIRAADPPAVSKTRRKAAKDPDPADDPAGLGPELTEEAAGAVPDHS